MPNHVITEVVHLNLCGFRLLQPVYYEILLQTVLNRGRSPEKYVFCGKTVYFLELENAR